MLILVGEDYLDILTGPEHVVVHVSYVDKAEDGTITAGRVNASFNTADTHHLVGAESGVERTVEFVSVCNKEGDNTTFVLEHTDGTVSVPLRERTLEPGDIDNWNPVREGKAGTDGAEGPQGPAGADGADGAPGADGEDGTDGTNGTNGADGADGDPAPAGWDAVLVDAKSPGTDGGTFASAAWRVRTLNTELQDRLGITLSSNQFSLGIGEYEMEWSAPAYYVGRHQTRMFNVTNNVVAGSGTPEYSPGAPLTDSCQTRSVGYCRVTIGGIPGSFHTFQLEHACYSTENSNGFGLNNNFAGNMEIYAIVKIRKLA